MHFWQKMKKMKKLIFILLGGLIIASCNNNSKTTEIDTPSEVITETEDAHYHHADENDIVLINGEKWQINEEMKPFLEKGSELVTEYVKNNDTDYKKLATALKDQNSQLIKSCTMQGQSHDELHKWLHPHLDLVKSLENETDPAEAQKIVAQLELSYQNFHHYFQ